MRGSGRRAPLRDVASAGVRSTAGEAAAPGLEATGLRKGPHESALAPARPASSRGQLPCGEGGARGRARGRRAATGSVVPSAGGRGRELVDGRPLPSPWSSGAARLLSRSGSADESSEEFYKPLSQHTRAIRALQKNFQARRSARSCSNPCVVAACRRPPIRIPPLGWEFRFLCFLSPARLGWGVTPTALQVLSNRCLHRNETVRKCLRLRATDSCARQKTQVLQVG